jgi:arginine repressor
LYSFTGKRVTEIVNKLIKEVLVSHSENFFSVCLKTCGGEGGKSAKKVAIQYFCSILKHVCDDNTPLLFKLNN